MSSLVPVPVAGTSIRMIGVRPSSSITSTVRPSIGRARHQSAISVTAWAMWPLARHSGSNASDTFGIVMYSCITGTIVSHVSFAQSVIAVARFVMRSP